MIIKLPEVFLDKGLTDRELVFAGLMYRIRTAHPEAKMFRMYAIDIKTIIGDHPQYKVDKTFANLKEFFDVDVVDTDTWYVRCLWKRSGAVEVPIEDDDAIRIWCYLLGRTAGERYLDENNQSFDKYVVDRRMIYGSYGHLLDYIEFSQF